MTDQCHTRCNSRFFGSPRHPQNHEANLSTIEDPPQAHARLSGAHENQSRTRSVALTQSQGARATRCLSEPDVSGRETSPAGRCVPRRMTVLRGRHDFETVLRTGHRLTSRNFVLRACPNTIAHARLGIIAGRKAAARAVDRNRGKRLIREAFHTISGGIAGFDVTVQLRNDLRTLDNDAVRSELHVLLDKLVRRCGESAPSTSAG